MPQGDISATVTIKNETNVKGLDKGKGSTQIGTGGAKPVGTQGLTGAGSMQQAKSALTGAKGLAMNPIGAVSGMFDEGGMIGKHLMKFLPKMLVKAIPIVGWASLAVDIVPMVIKQVTKIMTSAGSPFDKRFKRIVQREQNAFFNREEQRRRQLGLSPVIITSVTGFVNNGGNNTVATLKQVKERGISSIGLQDKAIGLK